LLLDLAEAMHVLAIPSDIIEASLEGIAHRWGVAADLVVFQSYALAQVRRRTAVKNQMLRGAMGLELRKIAFDTHWRLARIHDVLELVHSLAEGRRDVESGREELHRISALPAPYPKALVVLAYGVYGAAVAARIGAGWTELGVAALGGLVAGVIHFGTIRSRKVDLTKSFLAGLMGSLVVFGLAAVLPPFDMARALFAGVTLLVPAMVITIGVHELANEALESGVIRLAYGLQRYSMLGAGVLGAASLWQLGGALPDARAASALPTPIVFALLALGGASLTFCLQARWRDLPWLAGAVVTAYGIQALVQLRIPGGAAALFSAWALGLVAQLQSRLHGKLPAMIIVPGLLQLVPGFLGTEVVLRLLRGTPEGSDSYFHVLLVSLEITIGLLLAEVMVGRRASTTQPAPS
jgi:uncharacterized membrane protein YjjP (DUF1212 family)